MPKNTRKKRDNKKRPRKGPQRPTPKKKNEPEHAEPWEANPIEPAIEGGGAHRTGYVALVGRPNVGKSTILNRLLGFKLAATTHKPQTTRKNLLGALHPPGAQILLLDTPGHHNAKGPLNRYMVSQSEQAMVEADVVGLVVEARGDGKITPGNERLVELLNGADKKVVLLLNKVDLLNNESKVGLLPQIQAYQEALGDLFASAVPLSALKRDGLERVVQELGLALPEGPPLVSAEFLTNQPERVIVAELVREKIMLETREELPYAAAVSIDLFDEERPDLVRILATVHVERESQKPIVIGSGGERLKQIGTRARKEVEAFLGQKVFLELNVRVTEGWSSNKRALMELGYGGPDEGAAMAIPMGMEAFDEEEDEPE